MGILIAAAAAAATASAPAAAPPAVTTITVPAGESISAEEVAAYISPREVASYVPAPPPTTELVAVSDSFFSWLENITMVALFVVGFFLLARLLHAWMLHRSIRRALEAKSDAVSPLIDKLNKPYEHLGPQGAGEPAGGDDRNALVLLAIGLAMAGFGLIQGNEQLIRISAGAALFPAFVGIALLVRRRLARAAAAEERAAA
ncbi:hypothetical protein WBQ88_01825 [Sphingopyxis sp. CCNWLW253]|uniref:hypothetical protein n=1 Tax=unclassified Sphingopyxis TaxID=2614943 RepID=UPI0030130B4B